MQMNERLPHLLTDLIARRTLRTDTQSRGSRGGRIALPPPLTANPYVTSVLVGEGRLLHKAITAVCSPLPLIPPLLFAFRADVPTSEPERRFQHPHDSFHRRFENPDTDG